MSWIFTIDERQYPHIGISDVTRRATLLEDGNGGVTLNGVYQRSLIGTLYSYSMVIYQLGDEYAEEYDEVYDIITAPVNNHTVVVPYGQTTKELRVYITGVDDSIRWEDSQGRLWGAMNVSFEAQEPSRVFSGV